MPNSREDLQAVALLDEPVRRALYEWTVTQARPVSRDEAAAGVGVSRALAAFHLDRLLREGLLAAEHRRLSGRSGPGAGRPAKLYRRGPRQLAVSIPERRYDVAATLFADTLDDLPRARARDRLRESARRLGRAAGASARSSAGPRPSRRRLRDALVGALGAQGYVPREEAGRILLESCPFDALVDEHRDLVCGMNRALADGLLDGLGDPGLEARLEPEPGRCCIVFGAAAR
jgi:predicted ArsR family transcriptional regulator